MRHICRHMGARGLQNAFSDCFHVLDNKNSGYHFGPTELYDTAMERDIDASS